MKNIQQEILETYCADLFLKGVIGFCVDQRDIDNMELKRDKLLIDLLDKLLDNNQICLYIEDNNQVIDIEPIGNIIHLVFNKEYYLPQNIIKIIKTSYELKEMKTITNFKNLEEKYGDYKFDALTCATYQLLPD